MFSLHLLLCFSYICNNFDPIGKKIEVVMPRKKLPEKREKMIHVRLTDDMHKKLKIEVAQKRQTIQDWVTELIELRLSKAKSVR